MHFLRSFTQVLALTSAAAGQGVLKHTLRRRAPAHSLKQPTHDVEMQFDTDFIADGAFFVEIEVGTPPQTVELEVDTGSGHLWLASSEATQCQQGYCTGGNFTASLSSTFEGTSSPWNINYMDHSGARGTLNTDTIRIGNVTLPEASFGLAEEVRLASGLIYSDGEPVPGPQYWILGLGPRHQGNWDDANVLRTMREQDVIGSETFSLYVGGADDEEGHIIFGGQDKAKYEGDLQTIHLDDRLSTRANAYFVKLAAFILSHNGRTLWQTEPAFDSTTLIDTGYPNGDIPWTPFEIIKDIVPLTKYHDEWLVSCAHRDEDLHLTALFEDSRTGNQAPIGIPLANMLVPATKFRKTENWRDTERLVMDGKEQCVFVPMPKDEEKMNFMMGDPFFRSAYTVFDWEKQTVGMAQVRHSVRSDIVPI